VLSVPEPALASRKHWRRAMLLALAGGASAVLLTGVSVWFLGAVALAGLGPAAIGFNFHIPAALVRLLALTRTASRYGERLEGHRAALLDQVARRTALFRTMAAAPSTREAAWQLGNAHQLAEYMTDVEDAEFARLRVEMPATVLLAGSAALWVGTALVTPMALAVIAMLSLAIGQGYRLARHRAARHLAAERSAVRAAGQRLGLCLAALVPLKAEGALPFALEGVLAGFEAGMGERLGQRRVVSGLDALAGLMGPIAAMSVMLAAWYGGERGAALLVPAFVAFSWLALGDMMMTLPRILLGVVRGRAANEVLEAWTGSRPTQAALPEANAARPDAIRWRQLRLHAPSGRPIGEPIDLSLGAGRPLAIVGPSGSGKTTLLKLVAGWLDAGGTEAVALDPPAAARRQLSHLALHDAAVLSDTVRENLFAPSASCDDCWRVLAAVELEGRVRAAGGLDGWIGQDMLSLGEAQRLNIARALLTDRPIVLVDEPTEHLDAEQAQRVLRRVLSCLTDRIVVFATHDLDAAREAAEIVLLRG